MHLADEFIQSDLQCIQAINYFKLLKLYIVFISMYLLSLLINVTSTFLKY